MADQTNPDICPIHKTAMVTQQEHIGDGKTRTSEPFCPACRSIEAEHNAEEMKTPEQALAVNGPEPALPPEQPPTRPVVPKPAAASPPPAQPSSGSAQKP